MNTAWPMRTCSFPRSMRLGLEGWFIPPGVCHSCVAAPCCLGSG